MPIITLEVPTLDDGKPDLENFTGNPTLSAIKTLVDGLRGNNSQTRQQLETATARIKDLEPLEGYKALGNLEDLKGISSKIEKLTAEKAELEKRGLMSKELEEKLAAATAELEGYRVYGKPDEIKALRDAATYGTRRQREDQLQKAARDAGYDPETFLGLNGVFDLEIDYREIESIDQAGVKSSKSVPHVKDGGKWATLESVVGSRYEKFLPVLKPVQQQVQQAQPERVALGAARTQPASIPLTEAQLAQMSDKDFNENFKNIVAAASSGQIRS